MSQITLFAVFALSVDGDYVNHAPDDGRCVFELFLITVISIF